MLDLSNFLTQWAYPTAALVLAGAVGWLIFASQAWLAAHADFLNAQTKAQILATEKACLQQGVNLVMKYIEQIGANFRPTESNPVVRMAAQIVLNHAGGLLIDNGFSPEQVAAHIVAMLPAVSTTADTTGATIQPSPVAISTLEPIGALHV